MIALVPRVPPLTVVVASMFPAAVVRLTPRSTPVALNTSMIALAPRVPPLIVDTRLFPAAVVRLTPRSTPVALNTSLIALVPRVPPLTVVDTCASPVGAVLLTLLRKVVGLLIQTLMPL
ncbi:hypothetical protein BJM06_a00024 (plasmid) [Enterobacter cloacae]|nr:hypothetical protein BJM06_a00024 [Enterobacter cloacae]